MLSGGLHRRVSGLLCNHVHVASLRRSGRGQRLLLGGGSLAPLPHLQVVRYCRLVTPVAFVTPVASADTKVAVLATGSRVMGYRRELPTIDSGRLRLTPADSGELQRIQPVT